MKECFSNLDIARKSLSESFSIKILVNLDRSDEATETAAMSTGAQVTKTDFGHPAPVRNSLLEIAEDGYDAIFFIDADDLVDSDWLVIAVKSYGNSRRPAILAQSERVHFWGQKTRICITFLQPSSLGSTKLVQGLLNLTNLWGSSVLVPSEFFYLKYRRNLPSKLTEDWDYFCRALKAGIPIRTLPGHLYYRQRTGSLRRRDDLSRKAVELSTTFGKLSYISRKSFSFVVLLFFWSPLDSLRSSIVVNKSSRC